MYADTLQLFAYEVNVSVIEHSHDKNHGNFEVHATSSCGSNRLAKAQDVAN